MIENLVDFFAFCVWPVISVFGVIGGVAFLGFVVVRWFNGGVPGRSCAECPARYDCMAFIHGCAFPCKHTPDIEFRCGLCARRYDCPAVCTGVSYPCKHFVLESDISEDNGEDNGE